MTECYEPTCDRTATERINIPGEGLTPYCESHAEAVLKLARENGMGLGFVK